MTRPPRHILPVIVVALFAGSSLWFAGNAVLPDLERTGALPAGATAEMTIAVQFGFIVGTLIFAWTGISDRFSPRLIYLVCALIGAGANALALVIDAALWPLLIIRFLTGVLLAGVYPIGMKIVAGWFNRDLGRALGFLVGALVLGTALPHLIRSLGGELPWQGVMLVVSLIAAAGGLLMYVFVPDGPHLKAGAPFDPRAFATIFRSARFRSSAFGYFGHMWELYAFWAFVPVFLIAYQKATPGAAFDVSLWSFLIIAAGAVGCVGGGLISLRRGSAPVAYAQLAVSCLCCLLSPLAFGLPPLALLGFMLVWGVAVAGDSPQFSALNARFAPPERVGSALTIVNCIGFAITIVSIQLLGSLIERLGADAIYLLLAPGPVLGLLVLRRLLSDSAAAPASTNG